MLNWLIRKLFLEKEIVSKKGVVHFRRYCLFYTPWFTLYLHRISASDREAYPHDHPFSFVSFLLKGRYEEKLYKSPLWSTPTQVKKFTAGDFLIRNYADAHQLTLLTPVVWTLVLIGKRYETWGYQTEMGWVDHQTYRNIKNSKTGG